MIIITTQCFAPKIGGIEALMTGMAESMASHGKDVLVLADGKDSLDDVSYFKQEIKMAIKMSNSGAGPMIYKAGIDSQDRGYLVMEFFPYSVRQLIDFPAKNKPSWVEIEKNLRIVIKKMAFLLIPLQ